MITLGAVGSSWRTAVDERGTLHLADGRAFRWWVAAEDRWHDPERETGVRQQRIGGAPVTETRVRVPGGDVVQRAYGVADQGGLTVVELQNDSPSSVAVAVAGAPVVAAHARPADATRAGLPADAMGVPVGHGTTVRIALAPGALSPSALAQLPEAAAVAAGWSLHSAKAGRYGLPDARLLERVVAERAALALDGPGDPGADPIGFLLAVAELVRLGDDAEGWVVELAGVIPHVARHRAPGADVALGAAAEVLRSAGELRAVRDVERMITGVGPVEVGAIDGEGARWLWQLRRSLLRATAPDRLEVVPVAPPAAWLGQSIEVYGESVGPWSVGFAMRWHGSRPALLWEVTGPPCTISCPGLDPDFASDLPMGEALLAEVSAGR